MWGLIAIWAAGAIAIGVMNHDDDDSLDQASDQDQDIDENGEDTPGFTRVSLEDLVGTEFDDELVVEDLEDPDLIETITAGDGDDTIELNDRENDKIDDPGHFSGLAIDTGAGNDIVEVVGEDIDLDLGDGDDVLTAGLRTSTVMAGAGDDVLNVSTDPPGSDLSDGDQDGDQDGDEQVIALNVDAGDGDDVIDARYVSDAVVNGGAGDDRIMTGGGESHGGTGYNVIAHGGDGDDTIQYLVTTPVNNIGTEDYNGATGGEGADRFELTINEGDDQIGEPYENNTGDTVLNPQATFVDDNTLRIQTISISDFEPGVDTVSLDAAPQNDGYELTSLALEENDAGSETDLVLTYERAEDLTRQVVVTLGSGGVTWDDIELAAGSDHVLEDLVNGSETLTFDENGDLTGTADADSINDIGGAGDVSDQNPQTTDLGAGDDIAIDTDNPDWLPGEISGGDGDDYLVSETYGVVLNGGDGDDVLSGIPSSSLFGGAGDDTLSVDLTYGLNDAVGTVDGGDGADFIEIRTEVVKDPLPDFSSVAATGGEGNDTFNVIVDTPTSNTFDPDNDAPLPDLVESNSGIRIMDFDRDDDVLTIQLQAGIAEFDSVEVLNDETNSLSLIQVYFKGTDTFPAIVTSIQVNGISDLTENDFVLVS